MSTFRCGSCGAINRFKAVPEGKRPVCGKCKTRLDLSAHPQEVDAKGLAETLASSPVPVLVDFWAAWCGPCRLAAPVLERVAQEMAGKVVVLKLNTDQQPTAATRHGVQSLPTFALFSRGREIVRQAGLMPEPTFKQWIHQNVEAAA